MDDQSLEIFLSQPPLKNELSGAGENGQSQHIRRYCTGENKS